MTRLTDDADIAHLGRTGTATAGELDAPGSTWEIFARQGWLRSMAELVAANPPVSTRSFFLDDEWILDLPPPSSEPHARIGFHEMEKGLASEIKVAILVSIIHPRCGRASIRTGATRGQYLAMFGRWLDHLELSTLSDAGTGFGRLFMEALAEFAAELQGGTLDLGMGDWDPRGANGGGARTSLLGRGGRIRKGGARTAAYALIFLHDAGEVIERMTGARVRGQPFDVCSAEEVADGYAEMADRTTRRIPDAVLRRLLPAARRMLGTPAGDVRRLLAGFTGRCAGGMSPVDAAQDMVDFEFGEIEPGGGAWFAGLASVAHPAMAVRIAVHQVLCAAILVVLLSTGLRPGEVLGLLGGRRPRPFHHADGAADWLPRCVTEGLSRSGFSVAMLLHGHVVKRRRRPWPVTWLLALRQADEGDPVVLDALRTIEGISEILRPFAPEGARDALVIDFAGRSYDELVVDRAHSGKLAHMMRNAIPRFVDLSSIPEDEEAGRSLIPYKDSNGGCIALYQCRKTYAQTLYAISPKLLLPISTQFQHASPEGTRRSYVTDDPTFRRELEVYRSRRTAFAIGDALGDPADLRDTMAPEIDRIMSASAAQPDALEREALWARRMAAEGGLFAPGRLRPSAGAANLFAAAASAEANAPDETELGRIGPQVLRTWLAGRRGAAAAQAAGTPDLGRPARDFAIEAERRLAAMGFHVPCHGPDFRDGGRR